MHSTMMLHTALLALLTHTLLTPSPHHHPRYHPPEVKEGMHQLDMARELLQAACATAWSDFLGDFGASYSRCKEAVAALAHLDALQALATLSQTPGYCRWGSIQHAADLLLPRSARPSRCLQHAGCFPSQLHTSHHMHMHMYSA
jgi:hypothetical protein